MVDTENIAEAFDVASVIRGLSQDLTALRNGEITPKEAQVRADLAKQIFNGLRVVVSAQKFLGAKAREVQAIEADE